MTDPTGTKALRQSFLAEANRRLGMVRSVTHTILIEHDLMHTREDPLAQFLLHPGHRLGAFAEWFSRTVDAYLLSGDWWERYLQRAYNSGLTAGGELVLASSASLTRPLPGVFSELAHRELAGIAAAMVQQVSRQAANAALMQQKPQLMYRAVLTVLKKVGMARLKMFVNTMVVKLHNAARLEQFKAAGVTRVGIIPERMVEPRPSRFLKHDHAVMHDAESSAKRKLAAANAAVEELLAKQRRQIERETARAEAAAEIARKRLAGEIATHLAGTATTPSVAQARLELRVAQAKARAEIASAKAATAAREAEAKAAWEAMRAAQKEARAAEYAATRAARASASKEVAKLATKAAATVARAAVPEIVHELVTGALPEGIPQRLLKIGAEYVNSQTAGDDRVCLQCQEISEEGPYTLAEAQGMLPAHVNCRCAWVPFDDMRFKVNRELAEAAE